VEKSLTELLDKSISLETTMNLPKVLLTLNHSQVVVVVEMTGLVEHKLNLNQTVETLNHILLQEVTQQPLLLSKNRWEDNN